MTNKELHQNLISIILPAYNTREDFLRDAIDSVVAQTYQNWELLIIDDSTIAPVEMIVKTYSDERIQYFRNPHNLGMAATRNRGLELAQGEFIALLDHDDIWLPEKLNEQLKLMQQTDCCMVYSPVIFFGAQDGCSLIQNNVAFGNLIMGHNIVSCSCVMIRNSLFRKFNLRFYKNAAPADDYAMWIAIALYGGNIECTTQYLVRYRKHGDNVSANNLVCYHPYEWILKDITKKLYKTNRPLMQKLHLNFNIIRSRAWVLRKLVVEDSTITRIHRLHLILKAVALYPIHPKNWLLLVKTLLF